MSVYIDRIDDLSLQEEGGVIQSLTRRALVVGLSSKGWSTLTEALAEAGVPAANSYLDEASYPHLQLIRRDARVVDVDKAEALLTYEKASGPTQDLGSLEYSGTPTLSRPVAGVMSTSIVQKTTNKDANGNLITVSHTWPDDDPNYPGETHTQTGEINVYLAQKTLTVSGFRTTVEPWVFNKRLVGFVNNGNFYGESSRSWMCTEVGFDKVSETVYDMSFQFQHNSDGWDPTAVFIDQRTGQPPADLVDGVGIKTVRYQGVVDFEKELGFYIEGSDA
jgi:hypothetical protein